MARRLVVCVPARNEAQRLPRLIDALAMQTALNIITVVSLNNTTDNSREAVAATIAHYPQMQIIIDDVTFSPADAHAGSARRRAMDIAADIAGVEGIILTTDADTRPPLNWVAQNQAAMTRDLDIVGGRIVIDDDEPMSDAMIATQRLADRYWMRVREIEDAIDPVAWDPPPRHGDHTGASLCVTVAAYQRCGGVPPIISGEDRALVQAVLRHGGKLAHPFGIWTRVSPRTNGRAVNGMADHMKRMQANSQAMFNILLPSFDQWRNRAHWRRKIRATGGSALVAELENDLPRMQDDMILTEAAFG